MSIIAHNNHHPFHYPFHHHYHHHYHHPFHHTSPFHRDLAFILTLEVDWIALSFVQTPSDMIEFRSLAGNKVKLMAKLEKPSAIDYLDEVMFLINMRR